MARHHLVAGLILLASALVACGEVDQSPHAWCELDSTDEVVNDSYCIEGHPDYEWEYDDPSYNPALVPYFISVPDPDHPGRVKQTATYKPPVPGYKPPANYKPPAAPAVKAPAPTYKPPAAQYKPPAPAYKPPPPPPPKTGK